MSGGCYISDNGKWQAFTPLLSYLGCLGVNNGEMVFGLYITDGDDFQTLTYFQGGKVLKVDTLPKK